MQTQTRRTLSVKRARAEVTGGTPLVSDVMTTEVVSVSPDLTLRDALTLFADRHITGSPVLAGERILGVLSASDLLSFEATNLPGEEEEEEEQLELEDLESAEWKDEAEPPGAFYSDSWERRGDVAERADLLEKHTVSEAMTRRVWWVRPDLALAEAARRMVKHGIHRLLVLDHGRLAGMLTSMDVVRAVAENRVR